MSPLLYCPLIAFLLGSIPFGLILSRLKGVDIRQHGSGNIGATNVLRVIGKKYGIFCLFLDALKGFLPTLLAISLIRYPNEASGISLEFLLPFAKIVPQFQAQFLQVLTALLAILGHNYSPWVHFKGGKGIATSAGVLLALMPVGVALLLIVWLLTFLISRYVSLASVIAAAALPLITLLGAHLHGKLANGTWNRPLFFFNLLIAILAIWKHRTNLQRLRAGTEHRFSKSKPAA